MASDDYSNYAAGPRHAPAANVAAPDLQRRKPVGTISRPAMDSDVQGTGSLVSGVHRPSGGGGGGSLGGLPDVTGPIDTGANQAIVDEFQGNQPGGSDKPGLRPDIEDAAEVDDRPAVTSMDSYDHPLLSRIRAQQDEAYAGTSAGTSKPRYTGQFNGAGGLDFFPDGEG